MIKDIQSEILNLKKEKDIYILAHSYQAKEILEVADFIGDSFALSVQAAKVSNKTVIMCGVRFMAETVKILSPEKRVFIASKNAGCPMAEQISVDLIRQLKKENPSHTVVCYINTTAELKTECDVCVTSSSAVKIIESLDNDNIIFIPDVNLGSYIAKQVPNKNFTFVEGGCPIHAAMTKEDVITAKNEHKNALLLTHPECKAEVAELSDFVGSTSDIMKFAKESSHNEFIIGTEISITEYLQYECPEKMFYNLSSKLICPDMKATTLMDLYNCISGKSGEEILLSDDLIEKSKKCIDEMIRLG